MIASEAENKTCPFIQRSSVVDKAAEAQMKAHGTKSVVLYSKNIKCITTDCMA